MNQKETTLSQLTPLGLAWLGLGFDSNADRVRSYLDKLEVQIKSHDDLHLGRVNLRPVWEWGTPGTIQIEKDEFLLAGYFNSNAALAVETFTAPGASVRFPKVVRFKRAGADLYLYELKKYKTNSFNPQPNAAKTSDPLLSDRGNEWLELLR